MNERSNSSSSPAYRLGRRQFLLTSARVLAAAGAAAIAPRALTAGVESPSLSQQLGSSNADMLTAACGRIIPRTDTPGAIEAGVPDYIADVLQNVYLREEALQFADRLSRMAAQVREQTGDSFTALAPADQDAYLRGMENSVDDITAELFNELRQLTVYGYYTSEAGATSEHALTNYMAPWNGDLPYADVGRMWSG
jgi:hypothetical protein